jgi:predicted nucleotidyltransferase
MAFLSHGPKYIFIIFTDTYCEMRLRGETVWRYLSKVKLQLERLPASLRPQRDILVRCLDAMNQAMPIKAVYLFGSHARGDARPDSDVDLCVVTDGASAQLKAAQTFRRALRQVRPKPAFTLLPIAPERLEEKKAMRDVFFATVLREGVLLATEN